ncbi:MAG TPA: PCRF domain-containing protein, partial [Blastocatellia bacterium]|nr:PCRF domain-containing protein [Blastocatellia bacterium]
MFEKLEEIEKKYETVTEQLSDPELLADQQKYARTAKQHRDLGEIVEKYKEYRALDKGIKETKELLESEEDAELVEMARTELVQLEERRAQAEQDLKVLLLPK